MIRFDVAVNPVKAYFPAILHDLLYCEPPKGELEFGRLQTKDWVAQAIGNLTNNKATWDAKVRRRRGKRQRKYGKETKCNHSNDTEEFATFLHFRKAYDSENG